MTATKIKSNVFRGSIQHNLVNDLERSVKDLSTEDFFETSNFPIIFFNSEGPRFNYYAEKLFGYSREDLKSIPEEKVIQFQSFGDNHPSQKRKITIKKKDGTEYKFSSLNFLHNDLEVWLLFNDEENTILEDNLTDSSKILSIIYETTSDAMALINVDDSKNFSILSVNRTFSEIAGLAKIKMIGKKIEYVFPADILNFLTCSMRLLVKNRQQLKTEANILLKGENRYLESSLTPILNKSGKCVFILLIAHDITERKKKEDELLKAKNEAEESSRLKATLLANMSHEVRTPLTGILGFSQLLEEELDNPDHLLLAQNIRTSGKRLLQTLNSIIELSRLEAEKTEIYIKKLDLKETFDQLIKRFRPEAELKSLSLDLEINVHNISPHLDASLFNQIMINLLDNAIKFTKTGGIKIIIEKEFEASRSFIVIKVIDTGIGISKNNLKTIFKEFKQESEGWGRSHEGIGLGLSLVKRMTELMSGNVSVQSEKYKGSTFTVRFPIFPEKVYENSNKFLTELGLVKPDDLVKELPTVLLVEDNDLNVTLTKLYLKENYVVEHASNAYSALRLISEKTYSVILMDINLGEGMNGVDALFEIRKNIRTQTIPVIALTGYAIGLDEKNLLSCGFNGYLSKPFEKNQLLNIMNEVLTSAK